MKFSTKAIHAGGGPDPQTGAVMPPIYMTSTFEQEAPGVTKGYDYTRGGNPNFTILEKILASLEEGTAATVFSSGLGALTALASTLSPGDHVLAINGLYGGTYRLFDRIFRNYGILLQTFYPESFQELEEAIERKPKWLLFETPTNPLLEVYEITALTSLARKRGVLTIIDNTFATPYFQNPLNHGADIVWHSTTKYISGHSDVVGGAMITRNAAIKKELDFRRMALGLNPSPFDVWLSTRGVKTLALRMEKHDANGKAVAAYLSTHPKVKRVFYPGLAIHPTHEVAKKQMRGFGGMLSVEFDLSLEQTKALIASFNWFTLAESLGGVESLVNHPATMTHASIPREERLRMGIVDTLVRFSIGIEDAEDLIHDFDDRLKHC